MQKLTEKRAAVSVRFLEPCCPARTFCVILLGLSHVNKYFK